MINNQINSDQAASTAALESIEQIYHNCEQTLSYNCITRMLLKATKHGYENPKTALICWLPIFIATITTLRLSWIYLGPDPKNPDAQFPAAIGPTVCSTPFILLSGAGLIGSGLGYAKRSHSMRLGSLENVEAGLQDQYIGGYQNIG